jgi:hypothetical protein
MTKNNNEFLLQEIMSIVSKEIINLEILVPIWVHHMVLLLVLKTEKNYYLLLKITYPELT